MSFTVSLIYGATSRVMSTLLGLNEDLDFIPLGGPSTDPPRRAEEQDKVVLYPMYFSGGHPFLSTGTERSSQSCVRRAS
jgi:hypothetical protein